MTRIEAALVCSRIFRISKYIRFVGVINSKGVLVAYQRRPGLKPLLDAKHTRDQFAHIATKTGMESKLDRRLGTVEFVWEERKKVQIISFAINKNRVWVSIDKKVVRSEMLRIIDSCLPIVQSYS